MKKVWMSCSRARTCNGGLIERENRAGGGEPVLVRNPRVTDHSNATKATNVKTKTSQSTEINVS